jgi:hypothetical protein
VEELTFDDEIVEVVALDTDEIAREVGKLLLEVLVEV